MYITVWVVVCVIPACCFFYECLNEKTSSYIFWQKMDCFCFFINILLVRCHLHWQDWRFSIVHIFISFLNCVTKIAWDYWETHFVIVFFFKSTDSFRRQLSSRRNNLKLFFNECTLWTIFLDNREQASFHSPLIARYCRLSKTRLNLLAFFDHFPSHRGQRDISNFLEESSLSSFRPTGLK